MSRQARAWGVVAAGGLLLAACRSTPDLGPRQVDEPDAVLDEHVQLDVELPPGWRAIATADVNGEPEAVDDIFVASLYPGGERETLGFVGFDAERTHWEVTTNPSCVGSVVSRAPDGEPLVTILDSNATTSDGQIAEHTVATAFAPDTGEAVWGPQEVAGPQLDSGLVFGAVLGAVLSAEPVDTVALDVATGRPLELPSELDGADIEYEFAGRVAVSLDGVAHGLDASDGAVRWTLPLPDRGRVDGQHSTGSVLSIVETIDGAPTTTLVSLDDGAALGQIAGTPVLSLSPAAGSGAVLVLRAEDGARIIAVDSTGLRWDRTIPDLEVTEGAVGPDEVYLGGGADGVVLDLASGESRERGSFAVPVAVTASGQGLVPTGDGGRYAVVVHDEGEVMS